MTRPDPSDSELEESEHPTSEEEEEEEEEEDSEDPNNINNEEKQQEISAYEKQRLSRIAENKARMEALGLSKIASSLMGSPQNLSRRKGKRKVVEDDEEYRPNDEDVGDDDDGDNDNDDDQDEDFLGNKASRSDSRKVKKRSSTSKKKSSTTKQKALVRKQLSSSDYVDGDDELMQAIALSLQLPYKLPSPVLNERKGNALSQENTGKGKRKNSFTSRVQMTEDEVILHFFQFDEAGKGTINLRDLKRVAVAHDFIWTDDELVDMIHCFDKDGDGKLNLEDFRKIVSRCNMIREAKHP